MKRFPATNPWLLPLLAGLLTVINGPLSTQAQAAADETAEQRYHAGMQAMQSIGKAASAQMMWQAQRCAAVVATLIDNGQHQAARQLAERCILDLRQIASTAIDQVEQIRQDYRDKILGEWGRQDLVDKLETGAHEIKLEIVKSRDLAVELLRFTVNGF